jgi:hypothetical protein
MALRNSVTGRETGMSKLTLLLIAVVSAAAILQLKLLSQVAPSMEELCSMFAQQMGVAALPWLTLFRAARLGGLVFGHCRKPIQRPRICVRLGARHGDRLCIAIGGAGALWLDLERLYRRDSSQRFGRIAETPWL